MADNQSADLVCRQRDLPAKDVINAMPFLKAPFYTARASVEPVSPLGDRHRLTFEGQQNSVTPIISLLSVRGPSAVTKFVIAIVVDAVKRVNFAWREAHILYKSCKFVPAIADCDPTSSIVLVFPRGGHFTPSKHTLPNAVDAMFGQPVARHIGRHPIRVKATTTPVLVQFQVRAINDNSSPAVAFAKPVRLQSWDIGSFNYEQSSKAFAAYVDQFWHSYKIAEKDIVCHG